MTESVAFAITACVCVIATPPAVADTVFASAVVVVKLPVATPEAFVTAGCAITLLLPVTAIMTA